MTKKALGKGLKAFMPEEFGIIKEERFMEMDIDQLKPNPLQPRLRQRLHQTRISNSDHPGSRLHLMIKEI